MYSSRIHSFSIHTYRLLVLHFVQFQGNIEYYKNTGTFFTEVVYGTEGVPKKAIVNSWFIGIHEYKQLNIDSKNSWAWFWVAFG